MNGETRELMRLLSNRGTLDILSTLEERTACRYRDLFPISELKSTKTFCIRLDELMQFDLIDKVRTQLKGDKKLQSYYILTPSGIRLVETLGEIEAML